MNKVRKLTLFTALAAAISASALAAPSPVLQQTPANQAPRHAGRGNCLATESVASAQGRIADTAGINTPRQRKLDFDAQWSQVKNIWHNSDSVDMDGPDGPCRLVDSSVEEFSELNDGIDVAPPPEQIHAQPEANGKNPGPRAPDSVGPPAPINRSARLLHAYYDAGPQMIHPGPPVPEVAWTDSKNNNTVERRIELALGDTDRKYHASIQTNGGAIGVPQSLIPIPESAAPGLIAPLPAIPEPATYAMLLAGLACLAIARRFRTS